jgi:hypothetical protein
MLVMAIFLSICFTAVLFLLRFLFALESEVRSGRKRSKASVDHTTAYEVPSGIRVQDATPVLTLVHANTWTRVRPVSRLSPLVSIDSHARSSELKEA